MNSDRLDSTASGQQALRRLWGKAAQGKRGPRPSLDVYTVVQTAFDLADAGGLGAVSMARVAEVLGCSVMALYRHVADKAELLTLLADRVAAEAPALSEDLDWRAALRLWTQLQIDVALAHPWVLDLPLAAMPLGPHRARWLDQGFRALRTLDLPIEEKGLVLSLLSQHVLAEARVHADLARATSTPYADLALNIADLADPQQLPYLFAALAEKPRGTSEKSSGVDLILDGIAARLERSSRTD
jgi:AcrR family transcriptional regulator